MKTFEISIQGIRPLLMHRFPEETADEQIQKRTGSNITKNEAEGFLYKLANGIIYEPAEHIEGALRQAAKDFRIPGKRMRTYSVLIVAQVEVEPRTIPHKIQNWVTDARSVVMPSTRGRIMRYRPRFDEWKLDFRIVVNDDQIPTEVIKGILDHAGNHEGIGDYRPKFGRFIVTKFEEVK